MSSKVTIDCFLSFKRIQEEGVEEVGIRLNTYIQLRPTSPFFFCSGNLFQQINFNKQTYKHTYMYQFGRAYKKQTIKLRCTHTHIHEHIKTHNHSHTRKSKYTDASKLYILQTRSPHIPDVLSSLEHYMQMNIYSIILSNILQKHTLDDTL